MILKNHLFATLLVSSLTVVATGCSDDDWQPGPESAPGCMGVYFGELSSYNMTIGPDDSRLIPVTIGRGITDGAVSVPITVTQIPDGVVVPETVEFAADQQTTQFYIDIENMASKSSGTISLSLPAELTSPYTAGTSELSLRVSVAGAWIPVSSNVTLNTGGTYPDMTTRLLYLDGTNTFKLPDFFGSGLDLTFEMANPGNGWTYIHPTGNYIDANIAYPDLGFGAYPYDGGWFLYDSANGYYPYWTPDGVTFPEIDLLEFEDMYSYMQLISDDNNSGFIYFNPYIYYSDGTGKFIPMTFSFTTEFSPYDTTTASNN